MTEHPTVVDGFVDVYQDWIDLGIDGFRIDTAKHVNFEFWEKWSTEVLDYAARGRQARLLHVRRGVRRRPGQARAVRARHRHELGARLHVPVGAPPATRRAARPLSCRPCSPATTGTRRRTRRRRRCRPSSATTTWAASATSWPRPTHSQRDELAHDLLFLTRGQPVVYYGDEQGFAGTGGDKTLASRCSRARSRVRRTSRSSRARRSASDGPLRRPTARSTSTSPTLAAAARRPTPRSQTGAQIERYAADGAGVYAFSRVDRNEKIEYLVAVNNATTDADRLAPDADDGCRVRPGVRRRAAVTTDATGVDIHHGPRTVGRCVDRRWQSVLRHDAAHRCRSPCPRRVRRSPVSRRSRPTSTSAWRETSFAWRVVGDDDWHAARHGRRHDAPRLPRRRRRSRRARSSSTAPCRRMPPATAPRHRPTPRSATASHVDEPEEPEEPVEPEPQEPSTTVASACRAASTPKAAARATGSPSARTCR